MIYLLISFVTLILYMLHRNDCVLKFCLKLNSMAFEYHIRHLDEDLDGDKSAFEWFSRKYSYDRFLFSFKPLKLEAWFTQEELDKINS